MNSVKLMPLPSRSMRCLTDSFWIMALIEKCLPTSRRKVSTSSSAVQSRLLTTSAEPRRRQSR